MPRDYERRPRSSLHYGYGARSVTYELSREHWDGHYYPDYCGRDVYGDRHEDDGEERDRYGRRRHGLNQSEERWRRCSRPRSRSSERETEAVVYVEERPAEPETEEEAEIMRTMGFCRFNTTNGKLVVGDRVYVRMKVKQSEYREYNI
ncbi:unnamed protein product [Trichobilharzia szidati]|nr:unnamed protein product [Trichobilharzia szidati]